MAAALSKEFHDIQANSRVWIHSETSMWDDSNIYSQMYPGDKYS